VPPSSNDGVDSGSDLLRSPGISESMGNVREPEWGR
jgi:hypothetical protein